MVFENLGTLRYHALWAYTGLTALLVALDKLPIGDVEAVGVVLGPIAGVILADVIKHRNSD